MIPAPRRGSCVPGAPVRARACGSGRLRQRTVSHGDPRDRIGARVSYARAVLGGGALVLAFPPVGWWMLAPLGPALLLAAVRGQTLRGAFAAGTVFGAVFFTALLSWLDNLGALPWLALSATQALATGALGTAVCRLTRQRAWLVTVPCAWVAFEALRGRWPLGGFPWGRLAFSQADSPLLPLAALGGAALVTFAVAAVGSALAAAALPAARSVRVRAGALVAVIALTAAAPLLPGPPPAASSATVALVQGNVPRGTSLQAQLRAADVTANHAALTRSLAAQVRAGTQPAPDVVIWPENSTDLDPARNPATYAAIDGAVDDLDRPILVGAVLETTGDMLLNAGQLWIPGHGPGAQYVKRHLVPFGEYVPARGLLGGLGALTLVPRDFRPGTSARPLRVGRIRIGDVICYEIAYDDLVRSVTDAGANLLVVQSNNATYMRDGQSGETLQQLAMARLRAVEHDRAVLVATTTGVSAVIRPDGTVQQQTGMWQAAVLTARVPLHTDRTLADRLGAWPEALLSLLAAAALAYSAIAPLKRWRSGRAAAVSARSARRRPGRAARPSASPAGDRPDAGSPP